MSKTILGLFLGFLIGIGCRFFDIPLPSPPKLIGALIVLSMSFGYVGMDYLLARQTKRTGHTAHLLTTAQHCAGTSGLPPSCEQSVPLADNVPPMA